MDDARRVLSEDFTTTVAYLPHLVGALVLFAVGWLAAWLVGKFVAALFGRLGFDRLAERTNLDDDLATIGIRTNPAKLVGRLAFFILLLATLVQAVDTLELLPLSEALRNLLNYIPHIVIAVALVLGGVIAGDTIGRGTAGAMSRSGVLYHDIAGTVLRGGVIALAVLMALQQLTIDSGFLLYVLLVVLSGASLALGIAGGFGGRALAENLAAARYVERQFTVGSAIDVAGVSGTIERLDAMSTLIRGADGQSVVLPNALLARAAVRTGAPPPAQG